VEGKVGRLREEDLDILKHHGAPISRLAMKVRLRVGGEKAGLPCVGCACEC
jgi:hypothetical protein